MSNISSTTNSKQRFVIGVDFGTTYTSVAFAHSSSPNETKLVHTWPNGSTGNGSANQVPSIVYYTDATTTPHQFCWGNEVPRAPGPTALKWFKLLLQSAGVDAPVSRSRSVVRKPAPRDDTPAVFIPPSIATTAALNLLQVPAVGVVADFLSMVRKTAVESLERSYDERWVREARIEYVLTIPAMWSDAAKDTMCRAAEMAGFGRHREKFWLVSEPEAAAGIAYTLGAIRAEGLKVGDSFVICDAGGGTVDLISYKIVGLDPLKLDESVGGTGELCGSVFLDERFERYMKEKLGAEVVDGMKPRSRNEMMRTWEEKVKFRFGNSSGTYEVSVPGVPNNEETAVEDGFHTMEEEDVRKIFDPVVDRIERLVKQQVQGVRGKGESVAAILLVGGFGSSEYLLKRLKNTTYPSGIKIHVRQPTHARSAIVRGALLRGLEGSFVGVRRSRRFYGCRSHGTYMENKGLEDHRYWCEKHDDYRVKGKMTWFVHRDEVIDQTAQISFEFSRSVVVPTHPSQKPKLMFRSKLMACDLDEAPDYMWKNPDAVHRICSLNADLSGVSYDRFREFKNKAGKRFYRVKYHLRMTIVDEVLNFELVVDGKVMGTVATSFVDSQASFEP